MAHVWELAGHQMEGAGASKPALITPATKLGVFRLSCKV